MFCRWPEKEKVLQGNPQQELAVHLPAAKRKRGELVVEWKVLHERVINFREKRDTFREHIARRGWDFMYDPTIDINMTLIREFYANRNEKNQGEVYMRGRKIPCHLKDIEGVLHLPRLEGKSRLQQTGERYNNNELNMNEVMQVIGREGATWPAVPERLDKNLLNKDAWMWMKLVVSNIMPTRHETTLGLDHILLIYALMAGMSVSLPVPTYPGDEIFKVPKAQQFFPYGQWKTDSEVEQNPAPLAPVLAPAPVPPPAARTRAPASSRGSSSQQSRDDLMRALRRNERIMRRHEQLMFMLHPDLDISQLQQISSPEVSEQQQQAASDSDDGDSSDEDGSDEESSEE
ncbi:hypothetical protein PIB30_090148 [Stylosanthes scabra]|uniref:Putative plant transposon protein domain-containing protein n=1 Tax=Stylosanthes scabra TaxID=79078 RepID=A0ABU6YRT3_9FABA|nr:hypothetical protein [Stylosanthes scabra]